MIEFSRFVRDVPDFPKPGILFRDITPLLASPEAFQAAVVAMAEPFRGSGLDRVVGIEARGFMFGAAIARELRLGFVPVRKPGKLPGRTEKIAYGLEYGSDALEMHADAFAAGETALVVDDVLATGGTAAATVALVERLGARVAGLSFFIELGSLGGRTRLSGRPAHAVLVI
ncbi:MAG TPA: adenine phosphoribosyltransferase [Thermoanaerobaculia bacterium]|nr:adenine phosphoribosyltransferase [Thermoanaerobaculia bacterium]